MKISIVIPVFNGAPWLHKGLKAIFNQTLIDQTEVIIIDSGSIDNSLEIASQFPVRIHQIPNYEFNHGETRNLGAKLASGEFVVMTVQDAIPTEDKWLEKLLDGFRNDDIVAVCGQQIVPHELDKNPIQWFRPVSRPNIKLIKIPRAKSFDDFSPEEKLTMCSWDNVCAMYKRKILLEIPFSKIVFGEDAEWAVRAVKAGYTLVYNTNARVFHYHHEKPEFTFRRTFVSVYTRYQLFGLIPELKKVQFRDYISWVNTLIFKAKKVRLFDYPYWFRYNIRNSIAKERAVKEFLTALKNGTLDKVFKKYGQKSPVSLSQKVEK